MKIIEKADLKRDLPYKAHTKSPTHGMPCAVAMVMNAVTRHYPIYL